MWGGGWVGDGGGGAVEGMVCFAYLTELVIITAFFYNAIIILATLFAGLPVSDLCVLHSLTVRVSYAYDTDGLHSVLQVTTTPQGQAVGKWVRGGGWGHGALRLLDGAGDHRHLLLQCNHHTGTTLCRPTSKYVVGKWGWGGSRGVGGGGGRCVLSLNSGGGGRSRSRAMV